MAKPVAELNTVPSAAEDSACVGVPVKIAPMYFG